MSFRNRLVQPQCPSLSPIWSHPPAPPAPAPAPAPAARFNLLLLLFPGKRLSCRPVQVSDKLLSAKNIDLISLQSGYFCAIYFLFQNFTDCPGGEGGDVMLVELVEVSLTWSTTNMLPSPHTSREIQPSAASSLSKLFRCRRCP